MVGVILPDQPSVKGDGMEVAAHFLGDSFYHWRSQDEHRTKISWHISESPKHL